MEYTFIQHFDEKIYTQKKISVLNLLKKNNIEMVDLRICKEKTNTMSFRVNNRP